jgi:DNA-binding NarL/FixJ family response regulator
MNTPPNSPSPAAKLSPRELELLTWLNQGHCFKRAAAAMKVEESTVKTLASRAYRKLGVHNLQTALYVARSQNLID